MIDRLRARWPALRAAAIVVYLVYIPLMALPFPQLTDRDLERGAGARAVSVVKALLGPSDEAGARERLREIYRGLGEAHAALVAPVRGYYEAIRSRQLWNMFQGASTMSFQLYVDAQRAGRSDWELLYTVHDPVATFEARRLEYRRVRAAYVAFNHGTPPPYYAFAQWIAKRAMDTHPEVERVRVRLRRLDYRPRAEQEAAPEIGEYSHGYVLTRQAYEDHLRGNR